MKNRNGVLLSWVAYNNDPYERERGSKVYRIGDDGKPITGPTLTFLFDWESPYRGQVGRVLMFCRNEATSLARVEATFAEIHKQDPSITCEKVIWNGTDPTDHPSLFSFLREQIPRIRNRFRKGELLIHTSPGTPSMQTIWVLMGETGFIRDPFRLLKSLRPRERRHNSAVEPINLGIETFYKKYRQTRPKETSVSSESTSWHPSQFRSDVLKRFYSEAEKVAGLRVPVMILGERGTGKTTLANWIRFNSPFRKAELDIGWPNIACGQYQPATMRAEIFGYVKGAFTGAGDTKEGLLDKADGDTLFLDEVGDVTLDMQRLLIKAIEDGKFQPLGTTGWKESKFRLITATNVPLLELRKRLGQDFFDRIAVVRIRAPSLREMPEDLPWLWRDVFGSVLAEAGIEFTLSEASHEAVVRHLESHHLPGNLRDLYAVAWRLLAHWNRSDPPDEPTLKKWLPTALDPGAAPGTGDLARDLASRFVNGAPLDDLVTGDSPLPTKIVQQSLRAWIAKEIRRVAQQRGVSAGSLVDVVPKTLREWDLPNRD